MARNQVARILDPEPTLGQGFDEVACLRCEADGDAGRHNHRRGAHRSEPPQPTPPARQRSARRRRPPRSYWATGAARGAARQGRGRRHRLPNRTPRRWRRATGWRHAPPRHRPPAKDRRRRAAQSTSFRGPPIPAWPAAWHATRQPDGAGSGEGEDDGRSARGKGHGEARHRCRQGQGSGDGVAAAGHPPPFPAHAGSRHHDERQPPETGRPARRRQAPAAPGPAPTRPGDETGPTQREPTDAP